MKKVTVSELIDMLADVKDKTLPVKCICLAPAGDFDFSQWSGELDAHHLIVDDDRDEVMLTMDFT